MSLNPAYEDGQWTNSVNILLGTFHESVEARPVV